MAEIPGVTLEGKPYLSNAVPLRWSTTRGFLKEALLPRGVNSSIAASQPVEQVHHRRDVPAPPRRVSMPRSLSSAAIARRLVAPAARMSASTGARSCACRSALAAMAALSARTALSSPPQRRRAVRVAEPHAAAPGHRQRLLGALRDRLALLLRHQRHDADGEVVRLRQVHRGEAHAAVAQRQQERGVARQPVELGDDQRRSGDLGEVQRLGELRPIWTAPAFDLGEAGEDRSACARRRSPRSPGAAPRSRGRSRPAYRSRPARKSARFLGNGVTTAGEQPAPMMHFPEPMW